MHYYSQNGDEFKYKLNFVWKTNNDTLKYQLCIFLIFVLAQIVIDKAITSKIAVIFLLTFGLSNITTLFHELGHALTYQRNTGKKDWQVVVYIPCGTGVCYHGTCSTKENINIVLAGPVWDILSCLSFLLINLFGHDYYNFMATFLITAEMVSALKNFEINNLNPARHIYHSPSDGHQLANLISRKIPSSFTLKLIWNSLVTLLMIGVLAGGIYLTFLHSSISVDQIKDLPRQFLELLGVFFRHIPELTYAY